MSEADPPKFYDPPPERFANQQSDLRAGFGRAVGDRLDSTLGLWRLASPPQKRVQLYVANNFLSAETCRQLCDRIDADSHPSPLYEKEKHEGVRTSYTCSFRTDDPLAGEVDARISSLLGLNPTFGEPLQGQRYHVGQRFKEHADFFYIDQPYWPVYEPRGGQRTWTAMVYLNRPEKGGATTFRHLNLALEPFAGRLIAWNNTADDGRPNPWTMHAGEPVEAGTKYILTKWYRERPYVWC